MIYTLLDTLIASLSDSIKPMLDVVSLCGAVPCTADVERIKLANKSPLTILPNKIVHNMTAVDNVRIASVGKNKKRKRRYNDLLVH